MSKRLCAGLASVVAAFALCCSPGVAGAAVQHGDMSPLYPKGNVSASIGYNATTHEYRWTCTFTGWLDGPEKFWECNLKEDVAPYSVLAAFDGHFNQAHVSYGPFSKTTATHHSVCVDAIVYFSDGTGYNENFNHCA